ncbi:threonine ammonia-lyase [Nisaea acidiphila]|uniref:L-serine dehydratase n=1 Tax=Nisaea acidiphila TaxID=1862145 RepID=A0A9J7AVU5_9PROT|nr:threonine ammonia-lyase [Nisaea acidiphila]UUX50404.1 threonine ammonia-lyase [Nisaea acidiphila]
MGLAVSFEDIEKARETLSDKVLRTPSITAPALGEALGVDLTLKLENLQRTGSFKARGAYVKLASLSEEERRRGVIAMSAGNHAQGVAYHATALGIRSTIVMPAATPFTKVEKTRNFGATVVQYGDTLAESREKVEELVTEHGYILIHPYDDPLIIAGQGTAGLELMQDVPDLDTLVVPIGGGGLISGIALAARHFNPNIEIIGVQTEQYPSMYQALRGEEPQFGGETLAEGIAVKVPGKLTMKICSELVSEIILVGETEIERAVNGCAEHQNLVAEGAGAAGIAAMLKEPDRFAGKRVGTVICGGNIDQRMLATVLLRGLTRHGRLARLRIDITDQPGTLARVAGIIGKSGANIVEVHHQRMFQDVPVKKAELEVLVETRNPDHVLEIVAELDAADLKTRVMSNMAMETAPL